MQLPIVIEKKRKFLYQRNIANYKRSKFQNLGKVGIYFIFLINVIKFSVLRPVTRWKRFSRDMII